MNEWQCDYPGCKIIAHGVGGAIGLMAIGWQFKKGVGIFGSAATLCPQHRDDIQGIKCRETNNPHACVICASTEQANRLQDLIPAAVQSLTPPQASRPGAQGIPSGLTLSNAENAGREAYEEATKEDGE